MTQNCNNFSVSKDSDVRTLIWKYVKQIERCKFKSNSNSKSIIIRTYSITLRWVDSQTINTGRSLLWNRRHFHSTEKFRSKNYQDKFNSKDAVHNNFDWERWWARNWSKIYYFTSFNSHLAIIKLITNDKVVYQDLMSSRYSFHFLSSSLSWSLEILLNFRDFKIVTVLRT